MIRWIHFSDLHLGDNTAVDTRLMRRGLPDYISSFNQTFNYAFCSGNIKEWNKDYTGAADYIRTLCGAAHTSLDNLFIVPGNHDVDASGDERKAYIRAIADWHGDAYDPKVGVIKDIDLLRSGETAFHSFVEDLFGADRAARYASPHFVITTDHFNILHLDSTLTYAPEHQRDHIIGTRYLMDALDECDQNLPTIILTHYSFDFLAQSERNEIEKLLSVYYVPFWFAGHEHENLIRWQRDKFLECQCGNLALQKGARSCFLTGEFEPETGDGVITVHAWYEGKGWELYPFARVGASDNSIFPFALRLPGGDTFEISKARKACESLSAPGGPFAGVTINPTILTDLEYQGHVYASLQDVRSKLWAESTNALILGDGGMGKSTMMYHECRRLLAAHRLSVYISLQAREGSDERLEDYILRSLYQSTDERARNKFIALTSTAHTMPDLVLFIDGFNELSGSGAQRYVAEIKKLAAYPGIQIIVSSRLDFLRDYGLSHFGMIRTCDLREEQVKSLFEGRIDDWNNIVAQKNLRILLRNPMMALLYASTCPVVERHTDLDYLDWIMPITNASDLLHDYYLSQIAILIDREAIDGNRIFDCMVAIARLLPALAYGLERRNSTSWKESDFEHELRLVIDVWKAGWKSDELPDRLKIIKRRLRVHKDNVILDEVYDLIVSEMVMLKSGNHRVSFAHQIFRDYLAAVYLHNCLLENCSVDHLWHNEEIHKGVVQYLRFLGSETTWGEDGAVSRMLEPYRGKEAQEQDWFIPNIINCWLSVGDGERNLSGLDLRHVSLSDHLRIQFCGTINIDGAWLSKETLINDKHHDEIVAIVFSHDNRTMAAVSKNGIVSITNLVTQSQMIVGAVARGIDKRIGFDADDYLIVKSGDRTYKWPTISYDKMVEGNEEEILVLDTSDDEIKKNVKILMRRLRESDLEGKISKVSENGRYLAVGFESGFLQVWDTLRQDCIANLSLSDSQIATVSFTRDGRIAALGSGGKIVQIWDMNAGCCRSTLYFPQRVSKVRLDGRMLECQFADGSYNKVDLNTGERTRIKKPSTKPFISKSLLKRIKGEIESAPDGNAIVLNDRGEAYTWDERKKELSYCPGHNSKVTAIAMCTADSRFAASYSPEKYSADRDDGNRRGLLNNQKLVRVRIVSTGQCQWRLPTNGRSITKLQFFTSNRIILAGYCTNGDILLWELINEQKYGKEIGHWVNVEIVRNNQAEPLECAFPDNKKDFISAFDDGSIIIRPFSGGTNKRVINTIPGIDAGVFRWNTLNCDADLKQMLEGYKTQIQ